jgi:hypothetical protein
MTENEQQLVRARLVRYARRNRRQARLAKMYHVRIGALARAQAYTIAARLIPTTERAGRV